MFQHPYFCIAIILEPLFFKQQKLILKGNISPKATECETDKSSKSLVGWDGEGGPEPLWLGGFLSAPKAGSKRA